MVRPVHSDDALARFLEERDLTLLAEKPITFAVTTRYNNLMCCCGAYTATISGGILALFLPISTFCPYRLLKYYSMELHKDTIKVSWAHNDCCMHTAEQQKTVPLEKVQDVELSENWLLTCFGLKQVNVQTAGQGTVGAEVAAAWLQDPKQARDVIQLAVRLYREAALGAPAQQGGMTRDAAGAAQPRRQQQQGELLGRIQALEALVARGVLAPAEASAMRVAVLTAERDSLHRLVEAADLLDRQLITVDEMTHIKKAVVSQIMSAE